MVKMVSVKKHSLENLGRLSDKLRKEALCIVLCHGCFDILHLGHVRHFQQAKEYGDILIVTVTADAFVRKGDNRPVFKDSQRCDMIAALECVDYVSICAHDDASIPISLIKPQYYVKGIDYADRGIAEWERIALEKYGGKLRFTTTEKYSSTEIINRLKK